MTFGEDNCAYQPVENGKLIQNTEHLEMNNLFIKPIKDGDTYKHLGIDENISYVGAFNRLKIANDAQINKHLSNLWKKDKFITSQLENYHSTIEDKELLTKYLKNKIARYREKHLIVTTNADYVPPMLKT